MEDTLRDQVIIRNEGPFGLNPCFNGRYSQSPYIGANTDEESSRLNPCFNGRYSQS